MNKQQILFEKKNLLLIDEYRRSENETLVDDIYMMVLKNIEDLGFTMDVELIVAMKTFEKDSLIKLYKDMVKLCKTVVGGHVEHKPFYPNFPEQVMGMDEDILYGRAIAHYEFGVLPEMEKDERFPLIEKGKIKVIGLGKQEDFDKLVANLIDAKTSISEADSEIVMWALRNEKNVAKLLPKEIKLKENLGFVLGALKELGRIEVDLMTPYFKTATDVLRYVVQLSGGDVSLKTKTKFKSMKRSERRFVLELLEKIGFVAEDMMRHQVEWIRLGEIMHPGEFREKYPKAMYGFDVVRGEIQIKNFNSKVEDALLKADIQRAVELLSKRPGEFARKLDKLLRLAESKNAFLATAVILEFDKTAEKVSTPVLIQLIGHFKARNLVESKTREFFPKGKVSKIWIEENTVEKISDWNCKNVLGICESNLKKRFAKLEKMGNVYLDEELRGCVVPFSQRSASKSLKTFARGSKFDIDERAKYVRLFLYWQDVLDAKGKPVDCTDVDLSVSFMNENFESMGIVSYSNLVDTEAGIYHSGDIVEAPKGASEFIDIDMERAISRGIRYVTMSAHSYNLTPFCDLPYCFVGWMERESDKDGEIFEEKTVANKIDISTNLLSTIPLVFDLIEKKIVWLDMMYERHIHHGKLPNNVEANLDLIGAITKSMVSLRKMDLYELFKLHVEARDGNLVENKEDAEIIFSKDTGITPHDFDVIAAEYLV